MQSTEKVTVEIDFYEFLDAVDTLREWGNDELVALAGKLGILKGNAECKVHITAKVIG